MAIVAVTISIPVSMAVTRVPGVRIWVGVGILVVASVIPALGIASRQITEETSSNNPLGTRAFGIGLCVPGPSCLAAKLAGVRRVVRFGFWP